MLAAWRTFLKRQGVLWGCCSLLLAPVGSSGLPAKVSGAMPAPPVAVQIESATGPLTPRQSQAVLGALAKGSAETGIFEHHLAVEQAVAGSPLTTGNRVLLLQDGPATYSAMLAAIAGARDHVHLETYILDDDEVGQRFMQALTARQTRGVQVNLIRDGMGTLGTPAALFAPLLASGGQVLVFNPPNPLLARKTWELNQRDHRKLLIVDGRTAFLGGVNISNVYSGGSAQRRATDKPAWRDTHLQLQGPVVAEVQKLFLAAWASQGGPALTPRDWFPAPQRAGQQVGRAIGSSPDEPFTAT